MIGFQHDASHRSLPVLELASALTFLFQLMTEDVSCLGRRSSLRPVEHRSVISLPNVSTDFVNVRANIEH